MGDWTLPVFPTDRAGWQDCVTDKRARLQGCVTGKIAEWVRQAKKTASTV